MMNALHLARPVPQRERRRMVIFFGLGAVLVLAVPLLALLNGSHPNPLGLMLMVPGAALLLWSGQRLRSPEWGLHDWKRQPDALDERQKMRALLVVAQTQNISVVALTALSGLLMFASSTTTSTALLQRMTVMLWFIVSLMTMLPTLILAWTEPDYQD